MVLSPAVMFAVDKGRGSSRVWFRASRVPMRLGRIGSDALL